MKNLVIVAVVAWLLFFGGFGTLRQWAGGSLANAPQTIINGAVRVAQTAQPQATPQPARPGAPVVEASRPVQVVPRGMPALPTATPTPEAQQVAAAPALDTQATADADARVAAWLAAPASTDTPWPTATPVPTEQVPTFVASFQEPPECSPFVGYIGEMKTKCDAVFATQTAVATQD